ncbi:MAG TPA: hypothetical protein VLX30_00855 [Burkholderiales bacterium]|nr:hypothetical protein [Burkholderiales bacterium]
MLVEVGQQLRGREAQQRLVGRNEQRFARDAGPGPARLLQHRVADDHETHRVEHPRAPLPVQLPPAKGADELDQPGVGEGDDSAALVEDGQQVAQRAAPAAFARDLRGMARIQHRLGARKGDPGERVEQVVPVARAGRDLAARVHAQLVIRVLRAREGEPHRPAARRAQRGAELAREQVEALGVGPILVPHQAR